MAELTEAYSILTNPVRREALDSEIALAESFEHAHETAAEAYRREYLLRKWKKIRRQKRQRIIRERNLGRSTRYLAILIFPIAIFLMLDLFLPPIAYREVPITGWQRTGKRTFTTYMQTRNFLLIVPDEIHVYYDYYAKHKEPLQIEVSRFLSIQLNASVKHRGSVAHFSVARGTLYTGGGIIPILFFISCLVTISIRKYSMLSASLCLLPFIILAFILYVLL
jgi:hypothetical protein